jgi:hypothetical protein
MKPGDGPVSYGICPECDQKYPQPKRNPVIELVVKWFWTGTAITIAVAVLIALIIAGLRI